MKIQIAINHKIVCHDFQYFLSLSGKTIVIYSTYFAGTRGLLTKTQDALFHLQIAKVWVLWSFAYSVRKWNLLKCNSKFNHLTLLWHWKMPTNNKSSTEFSLLGFWLKIYEQFSGSIFKFGLNLVIWLLFDIEEWPQITKVRVSFLWSFASVWNLKFTSSFPGPSWLCDRPWFTTKRLAFSGDLSLDGY